MLSRKLLAHFTREVARLNRLLDSDAITNMADFWAAADEYWRANQARLYLTRRVARLP